MMAPAAASAAPSAKAGAFDTATLFVADKAARDEAAVTLAATAKKEGVEFFHHIGLNDALVKVSSKHSDRLPTSGDETLLFALNLLSNAFSANFASANR